MSETQAQRAERLAGEHEDCASGYESQKGIGYAEERFHRQTAATLRALAAANARLERERDEARKALHERILHWQDATSQRDAANAARVAAEGELAKRDALLRSIDGRLRGIDRYVGITRRIRALLDATAALTPATEAPTDGDPYAWKGEGPQPARWTAADGTIVYRSYGDYVDD